MIESKDDMTDAKEGIEDRTPEGHDPQDERGGGEAGGEAGAMPGVPANERANEKGHEARDEGHRDSADDEPGTNA